jgi:hypothetical protein
MFLFKEIRFGNMKIGHSSVNWVQLTMFHLKMEAESSLQTVVLYENRTMDNIQKHNNGINIPLSKTFRSYLLSTVLW